MKRRYDVLHAIVMILFLVIANFINNALVKGILLLVFSAVLTFNTAFQWKDKRDDKFVNKFFYGVLLILDIILVIAAISVIVISIKDAR
ncbi:hypothetical protein H0486_17620 [Lachnospiraceae bacterium MD1]|jgi:c-di-AMP phosphodiesterase-like protein|uniref:Uncharacterized protein n=1 Tax=Variimorphobacter saccharofermentans TaxID=2755051 RepID=A0A839K5R0_9FIRM|nr:hypothetical protein [Variimorphobacter saccharofermentans]MBB2184688.1 hypothetical protein [Variimorphobacter saccharofermentans]